MAVPDEYPLQVRNSSIFTRLRLYLQTWAFKALTTTLFILFFNFSTGIKKLKPSIIKLYKINARPTSNVPGADLECRVFIPETYKSGSGKRLPLYINIHGGGFFAGQARGDDKFCHYISRKYNMVVVSIEYRLAPRYPFPIPVDDCVELSLAILADPNITSLI